MVEHVPQLAEVNYLDKIVVASEFQGQGIGKILWQHLNGYSQKLAWRAKKDNPIIDFYKKKSDGHISLKDVNDYILFYYGLDSNELWLAMAYAIMKKPSLMEIKEK